MQIINWIKRLFKPPTKYIRRGEILIETDDDTMADVIAECYRTGKTVMKSVKEDERD